MKTISQDQFVEFMSEALPELISSIMREDTSVVSTGQISVPQFWALHYISQTEGLTVNGLAQQLNRSKSSTSALLQRLEKSGLVKRTRSTKDQRVVLLSLTLKGKHLIDELVENRKQGIQKTYSSLTAEERTRHKQMVEKIIMNARNVLIAFLLIGLLPIAHAQTNFYTLDQSIRIGLKRSINVANAAREREIAKEKQRAALSGALPRLGAMADYTLYDADNFNESGSTTAGLETTWEIFAGGRTISAIRAAKAYKQLTVFQERRIRENQVRDIALAYYRVQLAKAQADALAQSVQQLTDFKNETEKKFRAGASSEFDWLSASVSLANEQPRLIAAENDLSLAKESFRNLTYIDDKIFELTDPLIHIPIQIDLDQAITTGLQKRPDLQEKMSGVKLRHEDVKQQKSNYLPSASLFANYTYSDPDPYGGFSGKPGQAADHWGAGIRATWNLFDGFLREANVSESKLKVAIEEDEYRDLRRYVSLNIRTEWMRGRDAAEVIKATTQTVELAERALSIARTRFDAGLSTNLEVTQANTELSDARLARAIGLHAYMTAVVKMKHAMGTLLEEYE